MSALTTSTNHLHSSLWVFKGLNYHKVIASTSVFEKFIPAGTGLKEMLYSPHVEGSVFIFTGVVVETKDLIWEKKCHGAW